MCNSFEGSFEEASSMSVIASYWLYTMSFLWVSAIKQSEEAESR
jgi:hypothetical protein